MARGLVRVDSRFQDLAWASWEVLDQEAALALALAVSGRLQVQACDREVPYSDIPKYQCNPPVGMAQVESVTAAGSRLRLHRPPPQAGKLVIEHGFGSHFRGGFGTGRRLSGPWSSLLLP